VVAEQVDVAVWVDVVGDTSEVGFVFLWEMSDGKEWILGG